MCIFSCKGFLEDIYVQFRLMVRSNTKNPRFYYSITYTTFGYTKIGGGTESGQTIKVTGKEFKPNSHRNEKGWLAFDTEEVLLFNKAKSKNAVKLLGTLNDRTSRAFITIYQQTNKGIVKIADFMSINWIYRHENIVKRSYWDVTKGLNSENPDTVKKQAISTHVCPHKYDGAIKMAEYIVGEIKKNVRSKPADKIRDFLKEYDRRLYHPTMMEIFARSQNPEIIDPFYAGALSAWVEQVDDGKDWDHKWQIVKDKDLMKVTVHRLTPSKVCSHSHYHKYKNYDYFFDVWSNIHYGYVGLSVGFDEDTLLKGSDIQQFILESKNIITKLKLPSGDTNDDKTTIKRR